MAEGALPEPEIASEILEELSDGVLRLDRGWRFTYVNQVGEKVLGRPRSALLGRNLWDEFPELDGTPFGRAYRRAAETREPQLVEGFYEPFATWFEARAFPTAQGLVLLFRDIGDRKRLEAQRDDALRQAEEEAEFHETLHRVAVTIAADLDPDAIIQRVTDEATALCRAEFGAFFYNVDDGEGGSYMLYTLSGVPREAFARFPMPRNTAVFAPTFRGEAVVRSDDITKDARYGHNAPHHGMPSGHLPVRSYLAVPVVSRTSRVIGGLFFGHSKTGVFSARAERLVVGVARLAAVALENARLHTEAHHAQRRFRSLVEATTQIVWTTTPEGRIVEDSPSWRAFTGQGREAWLGEGWVHAVHPDDRERVRAIWAAAVDRREPIDFEYRLLRSDGQWRDVVVRAVPVLGADGRLREWVGTNTDVTDERAARRAVETTQARFRRLFESNVVGFAVAGGEGGIVEANDAFLALVGYERAELPALDWDRLTPTTQPNGSLRGVVEGRAAEAPVETDLLARDGRRVPVLLGAAALPGEAGEEHVAFVVDITARKRAERSLAVLARASRGLLASLDVDTTLREIAEAALPDRADWCTVYLKQDDGTLEVAAAAHADPSRQPVGLAIARRLAVVRDAVESHLEIIRTRKPVLIEEVDEDALRRVAGHDADLRAMAASFRPASVLMVPLVTQGVAIGTMTLGTHDAHRRFTAEDLPLAEHLARRAAIAIQNARLFDLAQRERRRVEEANRAKDEFLAVVSHELRTPLNAILGWARLLHLGTLGGDQQKRAVEIIDRNARAQAQLIEDLLDVSRIVSGKLRLEVGPVDMAQVVDAALDVVRPAADARDVRLQAVLDRTMGPILGDPDRLQQIVWNLLSNAVKFTPRGGRVMVTLARTDSSCVVTVEDSGQGIPPEFLPVVFERFRQASTGTTRTQGGLGLGLAIVRHIAELHGGTVDAFSEGEGKGSVFTVRLPISPLRSVPLTQHSALSARAASSNAFHCPPGLAGLKVLVVDDEPDARELLLSLFRQCEAEVFDAGSAEEAFQLLRERRPDVVVSDVGMPGQDGFVLIDRIRQLPSEEGGRTPAVALTAYARTEDRTRALLAGFNMHVPKPIEPSELLVVVANVAGLLPR